MQDALLSARMAVEFWKLLRAFERAVDRLPQEHAAKTAAQLRFSSGRLDALLKEARLRLVTFEGQKFEPNLPVSAINADEFSGSEALAIESTIEPAVVEDMKVLLFGKVILKKEEGGTDVSRN